MLAYLRQIADMIRVQQKLLQTPGVTQDIVGDARQRAVTFVNVFHLPVTPFKNRNAAEHGIHFKFFTVTYHNVKTAPCIIVPRIRTEHARAPLFAHTLHPMDEGTHDFTPYSALKLAFSAYASRSDVITSTITLLALL